MTGNQSLKSSFISRNAGNCKQGGDTSDWLTFLQANGGSGTVSVVDAEMKFLQAKGFAQTTYSERLDKYLASKGFITGTLAERYRAWLATGIP